MTRGPQTISENESLFQDGMRKFMQDVAIAQMSEDKCVEASDEVIKQFHPAGLEGDGYFWFQGVRVYEVGKRAEVEKKEALTTGQMKFGDV